MSRTTLTRYLIEQQREKNNIPAELRLLIEVVARACKEISHHVGRGALGGELGSAETENVQGEVQKKLDIISNDIMLEANEWGGHLAALASEEMEEPHPDSEGIPQRASICCCLTHWTVPPISTSTFRSGTIFSVLKCPARQGR